MSKIWEIIHEDGQADGERCLPITRSLSTIENCSQRRTLNLAQHRLHSHVTADMSETSRNVTDVRRMTLVVTRGRETRIVLTSSRSLLRILCCVYIPLVV